MHVIFTTFDCATYSESGCTNIYTWTRFSHFSSRIDCIALTLKCMEDMLYTSYTFSLHILAYTLYCLWYMLQTYVPSFTIIKWMHCNIWSILTIAIVWNIYYVCLIPPGYQRFSLGISEYYWHLINTSSASVCLIRLSRFFITRHFRVLLSTGPEFSFRLFN